MESIVTHVSSIFIPVTNLDRSAEWYIRMFGVEMIERCDERVGLAFPEAETFILLWKVEKQQPVEFDTGTSKMHYYNFASFDIHHSYQRLHAKGATVSKIHEVEGFRYFETFDPDGNRFNIVEETEESSPYYMHKKKYRKRM